MPDRGVSASVRARRTALLEQIQSGCTLCITAGPALREPGYCIGIPSANPVYTRKVAIKQQNGSS